MVGQVRTVPESIAVTGNLQKLGRMVLTFVQVYFLSVYRGIGWFTGERLAAVEQSGSALQDTHLVEQIGRYTAQAAASFEWIADVGHFRIVVEQAFRNLRECLAFIEDTRIRVILVMEANKSAGMLFSDREQLRR